MLLGMYAFRSYYGIDLNEWLGMHYPASDKFKGYQLVTYMFMHGGFSHLFFNMFALYMFGPILEQVWGGKKFFFFYLVTGLGAVATNVLVNYVHFSMIESAINTFAQTASPDTFELFVRQHFEGFPQSYNAYSSQVYDQLVMLWNGDPGNPMYTQQGISFLHGLMQAEMGTPMVGASGAIFGVLLAYGMLFPNNILMLLIPPMPIKAKWMVLAYGVIELFAGVYNPSSSIAHFAHLGGMVFGIFLILYWKKKGQMYS
jgi:membrane associated rhomboid family serine protease